MAGQRIGRGRSRDLTGKPGYKINGYQCVKPFIDASFIRDLPEIASGGDKYDDGDDRQDRTSGPELSTLYRRLAESSMCT